MYKRNTPSRITNFTDSSLRCQTVRVGSRRTSVRLEPEMWDALEAITHTTGLSLPMILKEIDLYRQQSSLTSAVRVFILNFFRAATFHPGETSRRWVEIAIHGVKLQLVHKQA